MLPSEQIFNLTEDLTAAHACIRELSEALESIYIVCDHLVADTFVPTAIQTALSKHASQIEKAKQ